MRLSQTGMLYTRFINFPDITIFFLNLTHKTISYLFQQAVVVNLARINMNIPR